MKNLRIKLAIYCAKAVSVFIQKLKKGNGLTLPGYVARLIEPHILSILAGMVREKIIVTTGTNGKTTTNSILCHMLKSDGKAVLINETGANMVNGIVSAFVLATGRHGFLDVDYACIEADEAASVHILPLLNPHCVILTNIFRDQLDRFGETDSICNMIQKAVSAVPAAKLILNCDDVLSYSLASKCPNPVITYGISQQIFDGASRSETRESIFCRFCGKKLEFSFFHYGQLGIYHCRGCGFSRPTPDYTAENITHYDGLYSFYINGSYIHSNAHTAYNIYNTLSACAALCSLNALGTDFKSAIESFDYGNRRENTFMINDASVQLHLAKNPIGFQQKISLIVNDSRPKDLIILINDTALDGKDISWLWDVDFQYLLKAKIVTLLTIGSRRYDMELRLKYEDIPCNSASDMRSAIERLTISGTKNLYIIVNYSGIYQTNALLEELQSQEKGGLT